MARMQERGIQVAEIFFALQNPDRIVEKGETKIAIKQRQNNHALLVVYKRNKDETKVITVIDTSKVDKYL